ncbi:paraquat-inducible protein A [Castellaniella sp.]|uniref:paraquat-inducible protein A n=1 Tax=Castellaniella sp. TaxID=1955812 RepID=UPI00356A8693
MQARQPLIACPHCDTLHVRLDPGTRGRAFCRCCSGLLYRRGWLTPAQWIAMVWTCLIVFAIAQWFPIGTLTLMGLEVQVTFWQALRLAWDRGYYSVSIMTGLVGFWFPLLLIALTLRVLHAIVSGRQPFRQALSLRLIHALSPWSMATVLILGILVSIVKMADLAHLHVGPGLIGFFLLSFLLTGMGRWNAHNLWRRAEDAGLVPVSGQHGQGTVCEACGFVQAPSADDHCRRCAARLGSGRRGQPNEVWALVLAAVIFYIPANTLPMMEFQSVLGNSSHTILGGVVELWQMGALDLAVIVFVASVMVPVTKLIALAYLLLRTRPRGVPVQRMRTRLYTMVEFIGQWSMLDVFVVVLMAAMANFPGLSKIDIGPAALNFGAVVVLTMWAAMRYDPRSGWDRLRASTRDEERHDRL